MKKKMIQTRYDKKTNHYHITYIKHPDKSLFRSTYLEKLMTAYDIVLIIETNLGSIHQPEPKTYMRQVESFCQLHQINYLLRPLEVQKKPSLFSLVAKEPEKDDYKCVIFLPKGNYSLELFNHLLDEYDLQIGYHTQLDLMSIYEAFEKGYCKSTRDSDYFGHYIFDSRLFDKILSTDSIVDGLNLTITIN